MRALPTDVALEAVLSTRGDAHLPPDPIVHDGFFHRIDTLAPCESQAFRIIPTSWDDGRPRPVVLHGLERLAAPHPDRRGPAPAQPT